MVLREIAIADAERRLFARQPRSPRRRPAGAVSNGAADAGPGAQKEATIRVELQRRRAAAGFGIVGEVRRERVRTVTDFVIAHEIDAALSRCKCRHPIMRRRREQPVVHRIARPPERQISEILGQHEQRQSCRFIDRWKEWAVVGTGPSAGTRKTRPG